MERNTQKSAYVVDTAAATALTVVRCVKSILLGDVAYNGIHRTELKFPLVLCHVVKGLRRVKTKYDRFMYS